MSLPTVPFTEQSNPLTTKIDSVSATDIVKTLHQVDKEIFESSSWSEYGRSHSLLYPDGDTTAVRDSLQDFTRLVTVAVDANLKHHKQQQQQQQNTTNAKTKVPYGVVFGGCGTSGRVAFMCARGFNAVLVDAFGSADMSMFRYIMAAGDDALVLSIELPEDDPAAGAASIRAFEKDFDKIVVVGITCGLSAPFVAGMLDYTASKPQVYKTVLVGFNPPELARNNPVEKWDKGTRTCRQLFLSQLAEKYRAYRRDLKEQSSSSSSASQTATNALPDVVVVTPIVGPEAITGSSRMKGGSATLIILNSVCLAALQRATDNNNNQKETELAFGFHDTKFDRTDFEKFIAIFENVLFSVYTADNGTCCETLGRISSVAAETVRKGGRVVYCGICGGGSAGGLGIMDASEMVDTYGCPEDEWRALCVGGWSRLRNQDGGAVSTRSDLLNVEALGKDGAERWLRNGDLLILLDLPSSPSPSSCEDNNNNNSNNNNKTATFLSEMVELKKKRGVAFEVARIAVCRPDDEGDEERSPRVMNQKLPKDFVCDSLNADIKLGSNSTPIPLQKKKGSASSFYDCAAEFALKLATNAVSTAAQIQRGAVFSNRMINVTVSNNKLFFRTLDMIKLFAAGGEGESNRVVDDETAHAALLAAIYRNNEPTEKEHDNTNKKKTIEEHVIAATRATNVLPIATLLASGVCSTPREAEQRLAQAGTLRACLQSALGASQKQKQKQHVYVSDEILEVKHSNSKFRIRNAVYPEDIPGAYHVCLKTGDSGADGEPFYKDDPDALGRVYVGPYMKFEPDFGLILENVETKQISGYSFGCLDTKSFFYERYEKEWRPELVKQFKDPGSASSRGAETSCSSVSAPPASSCGGEERTTQDKEEEKEEATVCPSAAVAATHSWTRAEQMHHIYHHPTYDVQCDNVDLETYPAHLHIDLLEEARGGGVGGRMLTEVMRRLQAKGACGVHLLMAASNDKAKGFYKKLGLVELKELGTRNGDLIMGKKFV